MIENFSKEELKVLIEELKSAGYQVDQQSKSTIFDNCVEEKLSKIDNLEIFAKLKPLLFDIADLITNNFTVKWVNRKDGQYAHDVKNRFVPSDKEDTYKSVMLSMLDAIKPYLDDAIKGCKERSDEREKMRQEHLLRRYGR